MALMKYAGVLFAVLLGGRVIVSAQTKPAVLIETAVIGKDDRVHLKWAGQKEVVEPSGEEQIGVSDLQISPGKQAVGWTVERSGDNFGTSYSMALELIVVWEGGRRHHIFAGTTIGPWQFEDGGKRVAVFSEAPHGGRESSCELYDTITGKHLAIWNPHSSTKEPKLAAPFHEEWQP